LPSWSTSTRGDRRFPKPSTIAGACVDDLGRLGNRCRAGNVDGLRVRSADRRRRSHPIDYSRLRRPDCIRLPEARRQPEGSCCSQPAETALWRLGGKRAPHSRQNTARPQRYANCPIYVTARIRRYPEPVIGPNVRRRACLPTNARVIYPALVVDVTSSYVAGTVLLSDLQARVLDRATWCPTVYPPFLSEGVLPMSRPFQPGILPRPQAYPASVRLVERSTPCGGRCLPTASTSSTAPHALDRLGEHA